MIVALTYYVSWNSLNMVCMDYLYGPKGAKIIFFFMRSYPFNGSSLFMLSKSVLKSPSPLLSHHSLSATSAQAASAPSI